MKELIHIHNQGSDLRADSREVAKLFGIEHESLRKTIEAHEDDLAQLGVFRFEIAKPEAGSLGGRPEKFCYLGFDQNEGLPVGGHRTSIIEKEASEREWLSEQILILRRIFLPYLGFQAIEPFP